MIAALALKPRRTAAYAVCLIALMAGSAAAESVPVWIPGHAESEVAGADLYYDGLGGRIVGVDAADAHALQDAGSVSLELTAREILYVVWVEDAALAEFEPPARVLHRLDREVVVATPGDVPRLTEDADRSLEGLVQPVRVELTPIDGPGSLPVPAPTPALRGTPDPVIEQMLNDLTGAAYMSTWQTLEDFVTRYTLAPENELATQWILDAFLSFGLDAEFHYYDQSGPRRNVVATIPGVTDPSKIVYVTSHLDSTSPDPYTCAPGADDNGSGTAAVIELARVMSDYLFDYTVKFACFNGEEEGLLGSGAYAADIAAAGEDVIAVYNMDMIAYRGTDPAPADLIIYTNTASVPMATQLESVIDTYLPGVIDPVVVYEAMGASDHASFWNRGYPAVLIIEEEAWGSDFCPWYHTCQDLVAQYPQDYPVDCARGILAATATAAGVVLVDGPFLTVSDVLIDDDAIGGSSGDGDGVANPGEQLELWMTVGNSGTATASGVTGELVSESGSATVVTSTAAWSDIPVGGSGDNLTAFIVHVEGSAANGEVLPFTLTLSDAAGSRDLAIALDVVAPELAYYHHQVDDEATGNGNDLLEPGEAVLLPVMLTNTGGRSAVGVEATLSSSSPYVTVLDGVGDAATIAAGEQVALSPAFRVMLSPTAPLDAVIGLDVNVTTTSGFTAATGFKIKVGTHYFDDVEADGAWLLAAGDDDASTGRWVRVDPIGTTSSSEPLQPEDDHTPFPGHDCFVTGQGVAGGGAGDNDVDGGKTTLLTPVFDLSHVPEPVVSYWRWYSNDLGSSADDTWVVQVSADGGATWVDLERTSTSENAWQQITVSLLDVITPTASMQVRFVASDTGNGSLVEAGVDDFEITGTFDAVAVTEPTAPGVVRLLAARPSPAGPGTVFGFDLPEGGAAELALYSVSGRRVRTLARGSFDVGRHAVTWDGRDERGAVVAPGVYFYRLATPEATRARRVVVVY